MCNLNPSLIYIFIYTHTHKTYSLDHYSRPFPVVALYVTEAAAAILHLHILPAEFIYIYIYIYIDRDTKHVNIFCGELIPNYHSNSLGRYTEAAAATSIFTFYLQNFCCNQKSKPMGLCDAKNPMQKLDQQKTKLKAAISELKQSLILLLCFAFWHAIFCMVFQAVSFSVLSSCSSDLSYSSRWCLFIVSVTVATF